MKPYEERLADYEAEKRKLHIKDLTALEYEKEIQKLAEKHKV